MGTCFAVWVRLERVTSLMRPRMRLRMVCLACMRAFPVSSKLMVEPTLRVPSWDWSSRRKAELGQVLEATREDGIEGVVEAGEVVGNDLRGVAVDVVLKVLAEETGAVPGQAAGTWLQEES